MRIVDVCAFYSPQGGGVKTYVERKLKAGPRAGHEIILLIPGERPGIAEHGPGATLVSVPGPVFPLDRRYRYFDDEPALHDMLDRLRPDIVEASSPWQSAAMVARWPGAAPRALIMHADPLAAYAYRWFGSIASTEAIDRGFGWFWRHLRRLDESFDLVVTAGEGLAGRLRGGGLGHVEVNPMGVEPGIFSPAHRDRALRREMLALCGLGEDALLLLGIGRLSSEKRWPMVIDAAAAAGYRRPIGLILLGDGRERAKILGDIGGNPHIRLLTPVTDRPAFARILASGDALVHGCEAETFCMVAAEARASGLPIIVPDRGGAADQIVTGNGETYAAADGDALASCLARLADGRIGPLRERALAASGETRLMDDHFVQLFARYAELAGKRRKVA